MATPTMTHPSEPLTAHDRCDADCPAQAKVRVYKGAGVLLFCGHHKAKHFDALILDGWDTFEFTEYNTGRVTRKSY